MVKTAFCPLCGTVVRMEPSLYFEDAPCPSCGKLLWFLRVHDQCLVFRPGDESRAKGLSQALAEFAGVSEVELRRRPNFLEELERDADSLDLVELVLEMRDEFSS